MHATTKQLLSLRDSEPVTVEVRQHIQGCDHCQRELDRVRSVQGALRQLPDMATTEKAIFTQGSQQFESTWNQIKREAKARQTQLQQRDSWRRRVVAASVVAASVVVAIAVAIPFFNKESHPPVDNQVAAVEPSAPQPSLQQIQAQLLQRNTQLEDALRELPQPPRVVRGETAYAIASFEDQIAIVDYELSYGEQLGIDDSRAVNLLQNRAELLNSLYAVRYTQAMVNLVSHR